MKAGTAAALRTRIYIDGYNLYYGCLKRTPYKWLDLRALFNLLLPSILYEQDGVPVRFELAELAIKFFTAPILEIFARSEDSRACQRNYHDGLRGHIGGVIQIIEGYYDALPARAYLYEAGKAARDCETKEIWKLEEKQSDVALALHAYSDALRDEVDHVVLVTNDTDMVPALEMIRQHTKTIIGLIIPAKENASKVNAALARLSHWTRTHITQAEFAGAQLPAMVRYNDRAIHKPLSWYPRPDLLIPIYEEARRVKRSHGAALKWLHEPCIHLDGRVPVNMTENNEEAAELRAYMDKYARDFDI